MLRAVLFIGLSIFAASVNAADLQIVAYAGTPNNVTAQVKSGMASPGMPVPQTYATVTLTPQFQTIVMPGMGIYVMYNGHRGSVSSADLQGGGWVPNSMVYVEGYYLDPFYGLTFLTCSSYWQN